MFLDAKFQTVLSVIVGLVAGKKKKTPKNLTARQIFKVQVPVTFH